MTKSQGLNDVLDRAQHGEQLDEKDFDMRLFRAAERVKSKYDIRFDRERPVPNDPGLADRCFAAGRELYAEVGTYFTDTGRVVRFTADEMDASIASAPKATVWGAGDDAVTLASRGVESDIPPFVWGGLQTLLYSDEETMLAVYRACCRCPAVHGIWGGIVPVTDDGETVLGGTLQEMLPYRRSAVLLRQAAGEAGRPGMCLRTGAPSALILAAQYAGDDGLRSSDGMSTAGRPELKNDVANLDAVALALALDSRFIGGHGAYIGGFSGSVEGAAIVAVAGAYQGRMVNQSDVVVPMSTHMQIKSRAVRSCIWVNSLACQALGRNTHLILAGAFGDHPAAGPGTEQYFHETAAAVLPVVVSGGNPFGGTRKFNIGQTLNYASPAESQFMGYLCKAAVGVDLEQANRLAVAMLERYEDTLKDAPAGKTLHKLYDLKNEQPLPAYRKVYDQVVAELRALDVPMPKCDEQ